jgi:nitrogen fixation NifU-like protein
MTAPLPPRRAGVDGGLHELYQQVILDHNRHPRNVRVIERGRRGERNNPICGDRVTVHLRVEGDVIRDASFQASGCAIVRASASLMTESIKERTLDDAHALVERFRRMIMAPPGAPIDDLGPLTALAGVRQFPIRVRCAALPWEALQAAARTPDDRA